MVDLELAIALTIALVHFGLPIAYYLYLRAVWLGRPWGVRRDHSFKPMVTVIVPTYNEARLIESKLDDIARQDYPRGRLEVIVVDSASTDGTVEAVKRWSGGNPGLNLRVISEPARKGKAYALNNALRHASGDIVVITDADSKWASQRTLSNVIAWLSDPTVGAVTCVKNPERGGFLEVEGGYRGFYNTVRLAESKAWSTPVFHGELAAYRRELLEAIGGFPTDIGADDSHTATLIALRGYRTVAVDDVECIEKVPVKGYHAWRIRRAQHLIQHFLKTLRRVRGASSMFKPILLAEAYLHLVNPWLLPIAIILLIYQAFKGSILAIVTLVIGALLTTYKPYRMWVAVQIYLIIAMLRNNWTRDLVWEKQSKKLET
jgi:cellulose synthase/poly-beta-1,6-N-acetylglucosamine synthase-like glycosyltransferase